MTNCSGPLNSSLFTTQEVRTYLDVSGAALAVSALLCLVAVILVFAGSLHKNLVYRLSLYQVFSSFTFSVFWVVYLAVRNYVATVAVRSPFAILSGCSVLATLMTSTWVVVHLFALAVCKKNLKKLEPLYVVSAILLPFGAAIVVALTLYTAISRGLQCRDLYAIDIEWMVGYGIGCAMLVMDCLLACMVGATLCFRAFRKTSRVFTQPDPKDKKALVELIPLLIYPVLLLVVMLSILIDILIKYSINHIFVIFVSSLSIFTTLTLILHVAIVLWNKRHAMNRHTPLPSNATGAEECESLCNESLASNSIVYLAIPIEEPSQVAKVI